MTDTKQKQACRLGPRYRCTVPPNLFFAPTKNSLAPPKKRGLSCGGGNDVSHKAPLSINEWCHLVTTNENKTAELSQRRPCVAPNIWVP